MNSNKKKIAEVTLKILENKMWQDISLKELKIKSKIKTFDKIINNKNDIIKIINNYFDYKLSINCKKIDNSNNKDMIFEILMMRFDILQSYRKGVKSIYYSYKSNPKELFFLLPALLESIIFMINFTKISLRGISGQLKIKGIFIIYISGYFVWLKDDTVSLEKTMIALDKYLDQAGKIIKFIN